MQRLENQCILTLNYDKIGQCYRRKYQRLCFRDIHADRSVLGEA